TRSDAVAFLLRALGYNVEVFITGRDLQRRVAKSSDFDVILIDRHTANPELIDLIGQLAADTKAANRPTFIIASSDKPKSPTSDQRLVRFDCLIGTTEKEIVPMPAVFVPDPRDPPEEIAAKRRATQEKRDGVFRSTAATRIARLQRVVSTTGLDLSPAQKLLFNFQMQL